MAAGQSSGFNKGQYSPLQQKRYLNEQIDSLVVQDDSNSSALAME